MTTAALLLGAGAARRFGADKLAADLDGLPVLTRSALALAECGAQHRIAVLRAAPQSCLIPEGYTVTFTQGTQSDSLRAGLEQARTLGATRLLIALGDMPFVPPAHLRALLDARGLAATQGPAGPMVPAAFPAEHFGALAALTGDRGAGVLLRAAQHITLIPTDPAHLRDIDRPEDLRTSGSTPA